MAESFLLPVIYKSKEQEYPAELLVMGYTHKIRVAIGPLHFLFEPDEEKNYRAVMETSETGTESSTDAGLLQAISETLHELFR